MEEVIMEEVIKVESKGKWKKPALICAIVALLIGGFLIFSLFYRMPLPYSERLYVEPVKAVVVGKGESAHWEEFEEAIKDGEVSSDYKDIYTQLRIGHKDLENICVAQNLRTINRDGEKVKIHYFNYSKTLFASLFMDSDFTDYVPSGYYFGRESGEKFNGTPENLMSEVYYIKKVDLSKLDKLSDEEYDKLHENLEPIWCGKVDYLYR